MSGGLAYILPNDVDGNATGQEIDFDLIESETHTNASELTEHPVEKDSDVTDHVKHDPIELSLKVWVTNAPIEEQDAYGGGFGKVQLQLPPVPPPANPIDQLFQAIKGAILGPVPPPVVNVLLFQDEFDKVQDTHIALTALERSGLSSTVVTSTMNYPNMILEKVDYEKTEAGSGSFELGFKQVRIVTTSTVAAPAPAEPRGAPPVKKGSQATSAPGTDAAKSLASKLLDGAKGAMGL